MWRKREEGSVLLTFLIIATVFVLLIGFGTNLMVGGYKRTTLIAQRNQAHYLAEAGVEEALKNLASECRDIPTTSASFPSSSPLGDYEYNVEYNMYSQEARITSKGRVGKRDVTLVVTAKCFLSATPPPTETPSPASVPDLAVLAADSISLSNHAQIFGNVGVIAATSDSITIANNAKITGEQYRGVNQYLGLELNTPLPTPTPPALSWKDTLQVDKSSTINADGWYGEITVKKGQGTLYIDVTGNRTLRVGKLYLEEGGKIILQGNGTLTLYVDQEITLGQRSGINVNDKNDPMDPKQLFVYHSGSGSGSSITLQQNSCFSGHIYAPKASMSLENSSKVVGTAIVESFEADNNASLTYYAPPSEYTKNLIAIIGGSSSSPNPTPTTTPNPTPTSTPTPTPTPKTLPSAIIEWEEIVSPSPSP
jgi:hypothetical protein